MRSRPRRDHVDEAEQVLVGVAKPHPAADPRLEIRCRPGHIERDHALVRVPDIDHPVGVLVGRRYLQDAERPFQYAPRLANAASAAAESRYFAIIG